MRDGYVYFVTSDPYDYVKIGFTRNNPFARLSEFQTGCPAHLFVATYVRGTMDDERRLHETFDLLHYRGEWFIYDLKLRDLVDYMNEFGDKLERECPRQKFEDAIWDVLISGFDYPDRQNPEIYDRSANAALWHHLFPEEDLEA